MKISLAGFVLCDAAAKLPPIDLKLNGQRVVEVVDFARAAAKGIFPRGNSQNTLTFSVSKEYATLADAQDAFFLAESAAPISGPLLINQTAAEAGRPPVGSANAALQTVTPSILGVRVDTSFTIQAGRILGGAALPYILDPDAAQIMMGAAVIPAGQSYVAVNFPAALNNPQVSVGALVAPAPGIDLPLVWKVEGLNSAGFVAVLTAPAPVAGIVLPYTAKATA